MKTLFTSFILSFSIAIMAQGPVAYYPFNSNANDVSGNNYHGTATGTTSIADRNSTPNSAYNFDGTNSEIVITDTSGFNVDSSSFSISYWFRSTSTQQYMFAFATGVQAFNSGFASVVNYTGNGDIIFGAGAAGTFNNANSVIIGTANTGFNDGNWHHVVGVMDRANNRARLYVDNILQTIVRVDAFGTTGGTLISGNTELDITGIHYLVSPSHLGYIGRSGNQFVDQYFNGDLDDVGFYDYALSASDVNTLYTQGGALLVQDYSSSSFFIYPNPASEMVHLNLTSASNIDICITNTMGEVIKKYSSVNPNQELNVQDLPSGIYSITIISDGIITSQKIVIK